MVAKCYPKATHGSMIEVRRTEAFTQWIDGLHESRAKARVVLRFAWCRSATSVTTSLRRSRCAGVAYRRRPWLSDLLRPARQVLVILLCGGDKSSQGRDIKAAQKLAAALWANQGIENFPF